MPWIASDVDDDVIEGERGQARTLGWILETEGPPVTRAMGPQVDTSQSKARVCKNQQSNYTAGHVDENVEDNHAQSERMGKRTREYGLR